MARWRSILIAAALACSAHGQTGNWLRPTSGGIYDPPTRSIRFINGYPGAAVLAPSAVHGLRWAVLSPDSLRAVAMDEQDRILWVELSDSPESFELPVPVDAVVRWSPDSERLFAYDATRREFTSYARVSSGLIAQGLPEYTLDQSAGRLSDFVIQGDRLLAITGQGLFLVERQGATIPLCGEAYRFLPDGLGGLWAVAGEGGLIARLALRPDLKLVISPLLIDPTKLSTVQAIALVPGTTTLLISDRSSRKLYAADTTTGRIETELETGLDESVLIPVSRQRWLLKSRLRPGEPAWIVDVSRGLQVFFVPEGLE